jgi:hypothetical protein
MSDGRRWRQGMGISMSRASDLLGDGLVLEVDPACITHYAIAGHVTRRERMLLKRAFKSVPLLLSTFERRESRYRRLFEFAIDRILRREPFVIPAAFYPQAKPIVGLQKYVRMADFIEKRDEPQASLWFEELVADIEVHGVVRHKHFCMGHRDDVLRFLDEYAGDLVDSLKCEGYQREKSVDIGAVLVGPDGSLHKAASGEHRFFAARILGVAPVPVRVQGVHADWFARHVGAGEGWELHRLRDALREVEARHQRLRHDSALDTGWLDGSMDASGASRLVRSVGTRACV